MKNPDDLSLLLDHWIIVRNDGTPILNGTPEKFEKELREFLFVGQIDLLQIQQALDDLNARYKQTLLALEDAVIKPTPLPYA